LLEWLLPRLPSGLLSHRYLPLHWWELWEWLLSRLSSSPLSHRHLPPYWCILLESLLPRLPSALLPHRRLPLHRRELLEWLLSRLPSCLLPHRHLPSNWRLLLEWLLSRLDPMLPDNQLRPRFSLPLLLEVLLLAKPPLINASLLLSILLLAKLLWLLQPLSRYLWLISLRPHPRRTSHHLWFPLRHIRLHPPGQPRELHRLPLLRLGLSLRHSRVLCCLRLPFPSIRHLCLCLPSNVFLHLCFPLYALRGGCDGDWGSFVCEGF